MTTNHDTLLAAADPSPDDRAERARRRKFDACEAPPRRGRELVVKHLVRLIHYCDELGVSCHEAVELALRAFEAEADPESMETLSIDDVRLVDEHDTEADAP